MTFFEKKGLFLLPFFTFCKNTAKSAVEWLVFEKSTQASIQCKDGQKKRGSFCVFFENENANYRKNLKIEVKSFGCSDHDFFWIMIFFATAISCGGQGCSQVNERSGDSVQDVWVTSSWTAPPRAQRSTQPAPLPRAGRCNQGRKNRKPRRLPPRPGG